MLTLKNKKIYLGSILILVGAVLLWPANKPGSLDPAGISVINRTAVAGASTPDFDKARYSANQASSLWVVVNKGRSLPGDYIPAGLVVPAVPLRLGPASMEMHLRSDAAAALEQLFAAAKADGVNLMLSSGYRSYSEQISLYNSYVAGSGSAQADTFSARPGHSEHQTGLAADIEPLNHNCEVDQCFASTPEGRWLAANAYKSGFIIRYGKHDEALTGYEYEPWHIRYVGSDLASQLNSTGQTLEQFFDLPAYQTYPANIYELKDV